MFPLAKKYIFHVIVYCSATYKPQILIAVIVYNSSVERQKSLSTSHLHRQLDPFASKLMICTLDDDYFYCMITMILQFVINEL